MTTCEWADPGESCDNEATHTVQVRIGDVTFEFPACDECGNPAEAESGAA